MMSWFGRKSKGKSRTGEVSLPGWYLIAFRDGGRVEQRLAAVERRLLRLDTPDPLSLLDETFGDVTLREMVEDTDRFEAMQSTVTALEERYGDRSWLRLGQPIMLDRGVGDDAGYRSREPERSDRWIMLVSQRYPQGGKGPAPLDTSLLVYYHAHRGVLAAIDVENPKNPTQMLWYFGSSVAEDCVSIRGGIAQLQLYAQHGPLLRFNDRLGLTVPDAPLGSAKIWPELAAKADEVERSLAKHGRFEQAPTLEFIT